MKSFKFIIHLILFIFLAGCQPQIPTILSKSPRVLAAESFLTDIAQQVAGNRLQIDGLIPIGLDPHAFEPTPREMAKVADCELLIINGKGLEEWLKEILTNIGGDKKILEASSGLQTRDGDPHLWLDPNNVLIYVDNIRDALTAIDPTGKDTYAANAETYKSQLKDLDNWIRQQVNTIPANQRLLVTNHETLGYFSARYGFQVVGSLLPSLSSDASPSAQQLAQLSDAMRTITAKAIFLDVGNNPQLANQIASETSAMVITDLYSETLSAINGPAPNYISMMKYNVARIVSALR